MSQEINYELVDCDGLATFLAEDAWQEEVKAKGLTIKDLYETTSTVTEDGTGRRFVNKIRPEWESSLIKLKGAFSTLIGQFKKDKTCNLQGKKTP